MKDILEEWTQKKMYKARVTLNIPELNISLEAYISKEGRDITESEDGVTRCPDVSNV